METALIFEWKPAPAGGAMLSPEYKKQLDDFFAAAKADGRVSGFEWFVSGNGDRLFLLAHGESDTVGRISEDRDLIAIKTMIQLSHSDFHMSLCASGETVDTMLAVQEAAKAAAH